MFLPRIHIRVYTYINIIYGGEVKEKNRRGGERKRNHRINELGSKWLFI